MMPVEITSQRFAFRLPVICALVLLSAACSQQEGVRTVASTSTAATSFIDPERVSFAVSEARALRLAGRRVWCVPFARNASGVDIRGNAETWWGKAKGKYHRGNKPLPGSVMAFPGIPKMPMGHIAVVSKVVSDREILVDQANWKRNQVTLGMSIIDISKKNDWSLVKVENGPESYGSPYPVSGFISPFPPGG